ncbi:hypothetical protein HID58_065085 [Brassica napus]|uniref:FBD domain-containing protein n=1 Tax=Brassica napus TaxID=3708 RepID=A0ABQ7ZBT7_BRANA|nr:hypothetical protein HID58_065085 [Brassica napus]
MRLKKKKNFIPLKFRMDGERSVKENQMRLSDLDDFLLCKILSGFPTKESVRTSVLSKRWRNLWLNVPALDLDSSDFSDDDVVMGLVDRFLLCSENKQQLERFRLKYWAHHQFRSRFKSCIDAVTARSILQFNVENSVDYDELVKMPPSFYSCEGVRGSSTILETLISSCPALEALTIFRGANDNLIDVCVRSQSLKTFELDCLRWTSEGHAVQIDAPRLESMTLSDHLSHSFIIRTYELMFSFILCLHRLFMITVKWNSYLSYPTCLSCMLASKKLHGRCCQPFLRVAQIYALSSWLVDLSSVPQCLQSSLEVLELETPYILREGRSTHGTSSKMKLAKYFLENCGALKELIVSRNFFYLIDKIMSIPRRSTGCEFFSF